MVGRALPVLVLGAMLAGCAAPAAPRDDAGAPPIPSALDVDLHESLLNISMPEGRPTALVLVNISEDMWVRPFAFTPAGPNAPIRPETYWVLCPWVRSFGLAGDVAYALRVFWLEGNRLEWATAGGSATGGRDADGGHCATRVDAQLGAPSGSAGDIRPISIAADAPRAGRLAVLIAAKPAGEHHDGDAPVEAPPFQILLGVARETCPDDSRYLCPPARDAPAEPFVRAGPSVYGACAWYAEPVAAVQGSANQPCRAFNLQTTNLPVRTGIWSAERTGSIPQGLVTAFVRNHGPAELELRLETPEESITFSCTHLETAGWIAITAPVRGAIALQIAGDSTASAGLVMSLFEIPFDFDAAGFTIEPARVSNNERGMGECN